MESQCSERHADAALVEQIRDACASRYGNERERKYSKPQDSQFEWVPSTLRVTGAFSLAAICFLCIAILEIIYHEIQVHGGIPNDKKTAVFFIRYAPTAAAVCLGFVWKTVVGDIKKIMPWSTMSGGWTPASNSLFINYVNSIEIVAVFTAARKRQWVMFLGLVVGFLCGAAVAAANALTYVDLFAVTSVQTDFVQTSRFDFDGTLVRPNASLVIPIDHLGNQPYGAVAVERLPGGRSAPWTDQNVVFDSFAPSSPGNVPANTSIEANVKALSANLECHPLQYSATPDESMEFGWEFYLEANKEDVAKAGCSLPVVSPMKRCYGAPQAWLNVTACSDEPGDYRIVASVGIPTAFNDSKAASCVDAYDPTDYNKPREQLATDVATAGLLCSPRFEMQDAVVSSNPSTSEVVSYKPSSPATSVDIQTSVEALLLYLINPTDSRSQPPSGDLSADLKSVVSLVALMKQNYGIDAFFSVLANGNNDTVGRRYVENTDLFRSDVERLGSSTLAQVVSSFARASESQPIKGSIISTEAKVFLRELSLRILQGILATTGIVSLLQATLLRPRTTLTEDPGPLAATAKVLATSNAEVEVAFAQHCVSSDKAMAGSFSALRCRLLASPGRSGGAQLELETAPATESNGLSLAEQNSGWRPIPLRPISKAGVVVAFVAVIAALAVLLQQSEAHGGLCKESSTASTLFQYIPSIILLLLSYTCSGIDSAVRSATSYRSLRKETSRKQPLLINMRDRPSFRTQWAGIAVAASSLTLIIFPFIKIVTAGLYPTTLASTNRMIEVTIDQSLMVNLNTTYDIANSEAVVERAAQFPEWSKTPALGAPQRDGILDNLVFANVTAWPAELDSMTTIGDEITAHVPAISVNFNCEALGPEHFSMVGYQSDGCLYVNPDCTTSRCSDIFSTLDPSSLMLSAATALSHRSPDPDDCPFGSRYQGYIISQHEGTYIVPIVDFSTIISGPVANSTALPDKYADTITLYPDMLNTTLPTMRAVSCTRNVTRASATATFTQSTRYGLNGTRTTLPWRPASYDRASVVHHDEYGGLPDWFLPPQVTTFSTADRNIPGKLASATLWPNRGASTNFYQLLAAYAEYEAGGNVSSLLDAAQLARAAEAMLAAYLAQVLTELRPFVPSTSAAGAVADGSDAAEDAVQQQALPATATLHGTRIRQDARSTLAIEALLVAVLACLVWVFLRFAPAGRALLPKEPDSVAARMSLLAGSELVQRLREGGAAGEKGGGAVWKERARLGWWWKRGRWRWGIDVEEGVVKRNWDDQPGEGDVDVFDGRRGSDSEGASGEGMLGAGYEHIEQEDGASVKSGEEQTVLNRDAELGTLCEPPARRSISPEPDSSASLPDQRPAGGFFGHGQAGALPDISPMSSISSLFEMFNDDERQDTRTV